jgi:hypothetical protein
MLQVVQESGSIEITDGHFAEARNCGKQTSIALCPLDDSSSDRLKNIDAVLNSRRIIFE